MKANTALSRPMLTSVAVAPAQMSVGISVAPVCPYGYFDFAPYNFAPYGYYGPDSFADGIFIGAGPWFHGPHRFFGHVYNRFDPRRIYAGPFPDRGELSFITFTRTKHETDVKTSATLGMIPAVNMRLDVSDMGLPTAAGIVSLAGEGKLSGEITRAKNAPDWQVFFVSCR